MSASLLLVAACTSGTPPDVADGVGGSEAAIVDADATPHDLTDDLAHPERCDHTALDRVRSLEYDVRLGHGRFVHVREKLTLRGLLHRDRRAILMLPGTVVNGSFYDLDVDGFRFQEDLAAAGMDTFAIDSEGSGESSQPADGSTVTHPFLVAEARTVLHALELLRGVRRMDVLGESNGGAIAAELCADDDHVRSCVMSSMLYRTGTPFFDAVFLDPGFLAFIEGQPNGYIDVGPSLYFNIVSRTSPDVTAAILANEPGVYAIAPLLAPTTLPWFDPTHARVPGLLIQGTEDDIATQSDADDLAAAYGSAPHAGGTATLVRIDGAGHIPRIEPAPVSTQYESAVFDFLGLAP